MQRKAQLGFCVVLTLLVQGCATTRTATVGEQTAYVEPHEVDMGFWKSFTEPWVEHRSSVLTERAQRRQQGELYHLKAMEAAQHTRIVSPYEVATTGGIETPMSGQPIDAYDGFSRYDEGGPYVTRSAVESGVLQPPLAGEPGTLPVAFQNTSSRLRTFEFWEQGAPWETSTRYSVEVEPGTTGVKYLRPGQYSVVMYDERGDREKFPRLIVPRGRQSSRYRDPYDNYQRSLTVKSVPAFVDSNNAQYFGRIRSDY